MHKSCPHVPSHEHIDKFDMLDTQARANPHPYYAWLQDSPTRRVYQAPFEKSFYIVHRFDDVKYVLTNHKLFSSAILPTRQSPFLALMDGANHQRIREVANEILQLDSSSFPKQEIESFIFRTTKALISKGSSNVFDEWATYIPLASLGIVFGLDIGPTSLNQWHKHSITINRALFVLGGTGPRRSADARFSEKLKISVGLLRNISKLRKLKRAVGSEGLKEIRRMFMPVSTKLENPRPNFDAMPQALGALLDLMNMFAEAINKNTNAAHGISILRKAISDGKLSKTEAIMLCTFILFAGYETTVSLLSNCVAHLGKNPRLLTHLKTDPILIDSFIEEALRYYTPVGRFLRRATIDIAIGDQIIPQGSIVIAMLGAANTDPERFEDPYSFVPERDKNQHISFGKGVHFCVGAPLARFQTSAALKELVANITKLALDDTKDCSMVTDRDNGILRYEELWVKFT